MSSILDFQVIVPILGAGSHLFSPHRTARDEESMTEPELLGEDLSIRFSIGAATSLINRIRKKEFAKSEWARLAWLAKACETLDDDELIAPVYLRDQWRRVGVIPYPHQLNAARKVISEFGGRAILADEVGLGKTIQAGLILKEYMLRGQAQKVLILCPAALIWQWYQELKEKFLITAGIQRSEYDWERSNVIIASLDTAKRAPHAEIIQSIDYDLLIVDEAHKVKNDRTSNYRFIEGVKKMFCLMLTATPVQNDLRELYNLATLTVPGVFGSRNAFRNRYVLDKRNPSDPEGLRERLQCIMIRNRRGPETVEMTRRHVQSRTLELSPAERDLYDSLQLVLSSDDETEAGMSSALSLVTLQREACSSSYACLSTLDKLREKTQDPRYAEHIDTLIQKAEAINQHTKVDAALDLVDEIQDRVIIFTEYRATQQLLLQRLQERGIIALGFDGSLSSSRKEWMKELFRRYAQVLVSTESGGEGLNFQFCCHVINYDLPWNPMKVEQRIGRVHRLGQTRDVHVHNLATRDTIEEYILYLLYEKIRLFEMAVGELDEILSASSFGEQTLEQELARILAQSQSPAEIRHHLTELSARIDAERKGGASSDTIDIDKLFGG